MIGADLIAFRRRFRMSKKAAAFAFGCSPRSIYNYELDLCPIPKYIALAASAIAMGLPEYGGKK